MKKIAFVSLLIFLSLLPACSSSVRRKEPVTSGHTSTQKMLDVAVSVEKLRKEYGAKSVLVVFDIDNTVLTMNQSLGSDQWFSWQNQMLTESKRNSGQRPEDLMVSNFDNLLELQYELFSLSKMYPPEKDTPALISHLQGQGHPVFALTSRGYKAMIPTLRELKRNKIHFEKSAPRTFAYLHPKRPLQERKAKDLGFLEKEIDIFGLGKELRPVQYAQGVFLTAGQNKGVMLRLLLAHAELSPKAIVFVDDHGKHSKNVQRAYQEQPVRLVTVHYQRTKNLVNQFAKKGKFEAIRSWQKIRSACNEGPMAVAKTLKEIFKRIPLSADSQSICSVLQGAH